MGLGNYVDKSVDWQPHDDTPAFSMESAIDRVCLIIESINVSIESADIPVDPPFDPDEEMSLESSLSDSVAKFNETYRKGKSSLKKMVYAVLRWFSELIKSAKRYLSSKINNKVARKQVEDIRRRLERMKNLTKPDGLVKVNCARLLPPSYNNNNIPATAPLQSIAEYNTMLKALADESGYYGGVLKTWQGLGTVIIDDAKPASYSHINLLAHAIVKDVPEAVARDNRLKNLFSSGWNDFPGGIEFIMKPHEGLESPNQHVAVTLFGDTLEIKINSTGITVDTLPPMTISDCLGYVDQLEELLDLVDAVDGLYNSIEDEVEKIIKLYKDTDFGAGASDGFKEDVAVVNRAILKSGIPNLMKLKGHSRTYISAAINYMEANIAQYALNN